MTGNTGASTHSASWQSVVNIQQLLQICHTRVNLRDPKGLTASGETLHQNSAKHLFVLLVQGQTKNHEEQLTPITAMLFAVCPLCLYYYYYYYYYYIQ